MSPSFPYAHRIRKGGEIVELIRNLRAGLSVLPLLSRIGALDEAPEPATLVDIALHHKVIAPLQVRAEFLELAQIVGGLRPQTVLEIGTFRGGTLFVFARLAAPNATLISLDLPVSVMGRIYRLAQEPLFNRFRRGAQSLHLLREDSHRRETLADVTNILHGQFLDFRVHRRRPHVRRGQGRLRDVFTARATGRRDRTPRHRLPQLRRAAVLERD